MLAAKKKSHEKTLGHLKNITWGLGGNYSKSELLKVLFHGLEPHLINLLRTLASGARFLS